MLVGEKRNTQTASRLRCIPVAVRKALGRSILKLCRPGIWGRYIEDFLSTLREIIESLGSGGSMVARLKLKKNIHKRVNLLFFYFFILLFLYLFAFSSLFFMRFGSDCIFSSNFLLRSWVWAMINCFTSVTVPGGGLHGGV